MSWPLCRLPPGDGHAKTFEGTLLGTFWFITPGGKKIIYNNLFSDSFLEKTRRRILRGLGVFQDLPEDVIIKLSRSSETRIRHLIYTWRAIEDNLALTSPHVIHGEYNELIFRLWRWCVCQHTYNPNSVLKQWKLLCNMIKRSFAGEQVPFCPRSIPGVRGSHLSSLWYDNIPWLWKLFYNKHLSKEDGECVTMLTNTRNFPPPVVTPAMDREEILDFQERLSRPKVEVPEWVHTISRGVGEKAKELCSDDLYPHISTTFSASFDKTRTEGGKGIEILQTYVRDYLYSQASTDHFGQTWFGREFWTIKGYPRLYTMCRKDMLDPNFKWFLSSSFRDDMAPGTCLDLLINGVFSERKIEEPIWGLDREFPNQLYQHSIEWMVQEGYLGSLKPYFNMEDLEDLENKMGNKPIPARAHMVNEPGGKIRWVTMEPAHINLFCQPLARMLANILSNMPTMYSAFNRSWKAWDFCDMLSIKEDPNLADASVSVFDLTSASDNLDRGVSRAEVENVLLAFFEPGPIWCYVKMVLNVVFRDRHIFVFENEETREIKHNFIARNGILMGNAMTKELLVLSSEIVLRRGRNLLPPLQRERTYWFIAGDDIALYGRREFFQKSMEIYESLNAIIKREKTFFSFRWVPFCQGGLFFENIKLFHSKRLEKVPYEEQACVDVIMSRLLVPFGIEALAANATARNPVIGKGAALSKLLEYYPRKWKKPMVIKIFHRNMGSLISRDPMAFLPGTIGGYECPHLIEKDDLLDRIINEVPNIIYPLFGMMMKEERNPIWLNLLFRRARTGITSRGIENPTLDPLIRQYETLLIDTGTRFLTWTELRNKTVDRFLQMGRSPELIGNRDIRKTAKRLGLMSGLDFAAIVDRSSAIRIFFLVAMGEIPLDLAIPGRGKLKTPSEVLKDFSEQELTFRASSDYYSDLKSCFDLDNAMNGYNLFMAWFNRGMDTIPSDFAGKYLPKGSYIDSLNAMRVSIWDQRDPDEPYVKGSIADPYRQADKDLFIGTVVTLDRVS